MSYPGIGAVGQVDTGNGAGNSSTFQDPVVVSTPGYVSGDYYFADVSSNPNSSTTSQRQADRLYLMPFYIFESVTMDTWAFEIVTASGAASDVRLGIYNFSGGRPTTVLATLGTEDVSTTGVKTISSSQSLSEGWYGMAYHVEANHNPRGSSTSGNGNFMLSGGSTPFPTNTPGTRNYVYDSQTFASGLPDLTGVAPDDYDAFGVIVKMRVA